MNCILFVFAQVADKQHQELRKSIIIAKSTMRWNTALSDPVMAGEIALYRPLGVELSNQKMVRKFYRTTVWELFSVTTHGRFEDFSQASTVLLAYPHLY